MSSHRNIKLLTWFNFFTDFQPFAPVIIIYFAHVTGSYAAALSLFSITLIVSALAEVPTGLFSDRIGRKNTVVAGAICTTLAFIFFALGLSWALVVGSIIRGFAYAFYSGNNDALLHDSLSENNEQEEYAHHFGKVTAIFQLSLGLSAILGGFIASKSFPLVMWLSVIPQFLCIIVAIKLIEPKLKIQQEKRSLVHDIGLAAKEFWGNEKLRLLNLATLLEGAVGESTYRFQGAFFATILPIWAIGFVGAAINVIAFLSFHYSGKIIKRFGLLKSATASNVISRILNIIAYSRPSLLSPILISLSSVPFGVGSTAENTLYQQEYRPEIRATMGSFNSVVGSILFAVVAYLLGLAADHYSPAKAILIFQLILIPTAFAYIAIRNKNRQKLAASQ